MAIARLQKWGGVQRKIIANRDRETRPTSPVTAAQPIIGGKALTGPADRMLRELGEEATVVGVARRSRELAATIVIDEVDARLSTQ